MNHNLLQWRDEFPILQETTYLVSHSLGAMPRGVYDSLRAYADTWASRGVRAWGDSWWALNGQVGDNIGQIIDAPPSTGSFHATLSIAASILYSGMSFPEGRTKLIIDAMIFPTMYYVLRGMFAQMQCHMVKSRDGITVPIDE